MIPLIEENYSLLQAPQIDKNDIMLIDVIKVDEQNIGKLDVIVIDYYGDENALPVVLDWNGITAVSDISIGQFIELPDIKSMFNGNDTNPVIINDIQSDNSISYIPGVIELKSSAPVVSNVIPTKSNGVSVSDIRRSLVSKSTIANSKLNIKKESATYNPSTGELTF